MKTTRLPMVTRMQGQMYFYAACRFSKTHSGFAHKAAGLLQERVEQERVEGVALWKRVFQTLKGDSALRNTRNTHMCVSQHKQALTHSHITHARALHNLCTQFNLFEPCCLLCHGYRADTRPSPSPRCRHTFL